MVKETAMRFSNTMSSFKIALAGVILITLSGCAGLTKAIGAEKSSPDEFAVVTKAPLVVPPDFALRPPRPGQPRPQELDPSVAAQQALFSQAGDGVTEGVPSQGEEVLIADAGAADADNSVRELIDSEYYSTLDAQDSFADRILFWRGAQSEAILTDEPLSAEEAAVLDPYDPDDEEEGMGLFRRLQFWRGSSENDLTAPVKTPSTPSTSGIPSVEPQPVPEVTEVDEQEIVEQGVEEVESAESEAEEEVEEEKEKKSIFRRLQFWRGDKSDDDSDG